MIYQGINIRLTRENLQVIQKILFDESKTNSLLRLNGSKVERKVIK